MSASQQYRVCFTKGRNDGACFIDAPSEEAARAFFAVAFRGSVITSIKLEPVDPCRQYEKRSAP